MCHVSPFPAWVAFSLWLSLLFFAHVVLLIALPLMDCLSLLLKLGWTLRVKVSHISTLEAFDVSIIFFSSCVLLIILASWVYIGCLAFPPFLIFFFFIIKSPSSWLILICSWGVFSCSTCGFGCGFTCCFTNFLVGHIEVRWPQVRHLKHFTCLTFLLLSSWASQC